MTTVAIVISAVRRRRASRVVLAWRIYADWRYDPDLLTETDVRFVALSER